MATKIPNTFLNILNASRHVLFFGKYLSFFSLYKYIIMFTDDKQTL